MAITEDEAGRLMTHIEASVRESAGALEYQGIIDLMNQWRSDVEAGRPIERKLTVRQSPGLDELADISRTQRTTSGDFVGREEYSKVDQLDMLVAAIGIAFVAPEMMAERFLEMIESSSGEAAGALEVRFVGLDEGALEPTRVISRDRVAQSRSAGRALVEVLKEITFAGELTPRQFPHKAESI